MKTSRIFMVAILLLATVFTVKADNDKPISFDQLPEISKEFIRTYFSGQEISYAKEERELFSKSYEVFFVNGTKIEFDKKGNWDTVDCRREAVPSGIVPALIVDYVTKNHPNLMIVKIDKDKRDYEIELNNGIEIKFDLKYNVIGYDD